jgi:carbonic anhydrase
LYFNNLIDFLKSKKIEDKFDLSKIIDETSLSFFYEGSFTTPPCTEGVKWYIMKNPIFISKEQMNTIIKSTIFVKSNARGVQKFNPEKF